MKPAALRTEHLDEPLGIDMVRPRLSWQLPSEVGRQHAYRVQAGSWDSGRVASEQSVLVPYAGPEPAARERVHWRVKVWTESGESAWSEPAWFELGLLAAPDWRARWIEPDEDPAARDADLRPARLVRTEFGVRHAIERARLYATAHGIYTAWINGTRVGDSELTPGFTAYHDRLQVQTYDVTDVVEPGANSLGAVLGDGWWRGRVGVFQHRNGFGDALGFLAQLEITDGNGTTTTVGTDSTWRSATAEIIGADLMWGESVDGSRARPGWSTPGHDVGEWGGVTETNGDLDALCASPSPPVRCIDEIRPETIRRLDTDRQIVDLGVNTNGRLRLEGLGSETELTITHGETLDRDGDVTLDHLQPPGLDIEVARQRDSVRAAARFEPQFTTHGFRYARIEGHSDDLDPDNVAGVEVHTDMRRTGWFRCSDQRVNAFHDIVVNSFTANACDVPTDCPTRERSGWTGDWQIFAPVAAFLYDVAGFSTKWLRDLAVEQRADGAVPSIVPSPRRADHTRPDALFDTFCGSAGWGDAAVLVPWAMYRAYGDARLLDEQWPSMQAWVDYGATRARTDRNARRAAQQPEPRAHEEFLWDTGYHWGEWLPADKEFDVAITEHMSSIFVHGVPDIATAYLAHSAATLASCARVLGRDADAGRYEELGRNARGAWQAEFVGADGSLTPDTQANHLRALAFDLVPVEDRRALVERLVGLIRAADTHLTTGFLGTPLLLPALADAGELGLAYELLLQKTAPAWLVMVDRGASTVWESFASVDAGGAAAGSLNHYSLGAVIGFLHEYVGGIRIEAAGYRSFRIAPRPGGGLTWAQTAHESPYGRIESNWRIAGGAFELDVLVPANTSATIALPDGTTHSAAPGRHRYSA